MFVTEQITAVITAMKIKSVLVSNLNLKTCSSVRGLAKSNTRVLQEFRLEPRKEKCNDFLDRYFPQSSTVQFASPAMTYANMRCRKELKDLF